jgi:hypothetical protein
MGCEHESLGNWRPLLKRGEILGVVRYDMNKPWRAREFLALPIEKRFDKCYTLSTPSSALPRPGQ